MGNNSYLSINEQEIDRFKYEIPFHALIAFDPSEYNDGIFTTTIAEAKRRYRDCGITLERMNNKLSSMLGVDLNTIKMLRQTGMNETASDWEGESLEALMDTLYEIHPVIVSVYEILNNLERNRDDEILKLNVTEIRDMMEDDWYADIGELFEQSKKEYESSLRTINILEDFKDYEFFICHDSNDKDEFVTPLAEKLRDRNIKIWYDRFVLTIGDSLIDKIDEGLKSCKYGIVVLSRGFLKNSTWPKNEFNSLKIRELHSGQKLILPIWRTGITKSDVAKYNLELANRFALREEDGLQSIINALEAKIRS